MSSAVAHLKKHYKLPPGADGKYLIRADLRGVSCSTCNLAGANLRNADLSNSIFPLSHFDGADLTNANLSHSNLISANFTGAILIGVNLTGADLRMLDSQNDLEFLRSQGCIWDTNNPPKVGNSIRVPVTSESKL